MLQHMYQRIEVLRVAIRLDAAAHTDIDGNAFYDSAGQPGVRRA